MVEGSAATHHEWRDKTISVAHDVMVDDKTGHILARIATTNVGKTLTRVPRPLVMPWAQGTDKNHLTVYDESGHELTNLADHLDFALDPNGEQVLPFVELEPGQSHVSDFDLNELFENVARAKTLKIKLSYESPRDHACMRDAERNIVQKPCWRGRAELEPLEYHPDRRKVNK